MAIKKTAPTCKKKKETCVSDQRDTVVISRATLPFTGHKKKNMYREGSPIPAELELKKKWFAAGFTLTTFLVAPSYVTLQISFGSLCYF